MKIYLILLTILSFSYTNYAYSAACLYQGKVDTCVSANQSWTYLSIEDFVCILWSKERITFQIALDTRFKVLDEDMDTYITELDDNKTKYFWISREKTFVDWINDIHEKSLYFYNEYKSICWKQLIEEVADCKDSKSVSIWEAKKMFTECMLLIDTKMEIFEDVTFSILMLNQQQVKTDEKKIYDQEEKKNYNKLIEILRINIWYIERLWSKTPSLTWDPK